MWFFADLDPVGQFVVERIAIIKKSAVFDMEPTRVLARTAIEESGRRRARQALQRLH
jgi:hypothetical protein